MTGGPADGELAGLRAEVSAVDRAILDLVARRVELAGRIWEVKRARGLDVVDPRREDELLAELTAANGGRLGDDTVAALHRELLALTKAELGRTPVPL